MISLCIYHAIYIVFVFTTHGDGTVLVSVTLSISFNMFLA